MIGQSRKRNGRKKERNEKSFPSNAKGLTSGGNVAWFWMHIYSNMLRFYRIYYDNNLFKQLIRTNRGDEIIVPSLHVTVHWNNNIYFLF